jgi:hypothetical protein
MLAVAAMAGAASFRHVHDWTMHNSPVGTGDWFGWANAMVSELIPLAAGLEVRRRIRQARPVGWYPVALILAAVALSLTGQFAEAKPSISGWLIAAVPALGFLALVKLVLSGPTPTTTDTPPITESDIHHVDPEPVVEQPPAPHPTPVAALETVPAHLLPAARFAAQQHRQATGRPITGDELAARMNLAPATAAGLLTHLTPPATVNGASLPGGDQ